MVQVICMWLIQKTPLSARFSERNLEKYHPDVIGIICTRQSDLELGCLHFDAIINLEGKSKSWVAGNENLHSKVGVRLGLMKVIVAPSRWKKIAPALEQ